MNKWLPAIAFSVLLLGFPGEAEAISIFEPPDFSSVILVHTDLGSFANSDYTATIEGSITGFVPQDIRDVVKYLHTGSDGMLEITLTFSDFVPHPLFTCVSFSVVIGASSNGICPTQNGSESFSMFVNSGDEVKMRVGLNGQLTASLANYEIEIKHSPQEVVGGKTLPIDSTSLLVAGASSSAWMIPLILSGIGIGLFVVSRKSENS